MLWLCWNVRRGCLLTRWKWIKILWLSKGESALLHLILKTIKVDKVKMNSSTAWNLKYTFLSKTANFIRFWAIWQQMRYLILRIQLIRILLVLKVWAYYKLHILSFFSLVIFLKFDIGLIFSINYIKFFSFICPGGGYNW